MEQLNNSTTKNIYLDHSATTAVDQLVFETMKPYITTVFGNPGSIHSFGREAKKALDQARKFTAFFLGCDASEIIFTSGGSESDNLAIRGTVNGLRLKAEGEKGTNRPGHSSSRLPHVITSAIEHKAVLDTVRILEKEGKIEATYIKPKPNGVIDTAEVKAAIKENTVLVSVMYINNEVGAIQPIREIGKLLKEVNKDRLTSGLLPIAFHTDAVQAIEYCQINPDYLGVDLLSASAHKFNGPKGVGFLYVRKGTRLNPIITGGGQERGLRASTENVAGIIGMSTALELIVRNRAKSKVIERHKDIHKSIYYDQTTEKIIKLRDRLIEGLLTIPNSILNGERSFLAPHIANISFINAEGEAILLNLDFLGIAVSTGSACTSHSLEPSHVLTAMGIPPEKAHGSIRFSLGQENTEEEIDYVIKVMPGIIKRLREMSPYKF